MSNAVSRALACAVAVGAVLAAGSANARLIELKLGAPEPFVEGRMFGETGAYVRIKGTARGELDPNAPEHAAIVGLDKAPRNARGLVEYEVDVFILRPADPAKGNGILFYENLNRGNKQLVNRLHDGGCNEAELIYQKAPAHDG